MTKSGPVADWQVSVAEVHLIELTKRAKPASLVAIADYLEAAPVEFREASNCSAVAVLRSIIPLS